MAKVEIMAPAGNFASLNAAIKAGADSVYFGVGNLNMRARAAMNFTKEDLKEIVKICKKARVKTYLTVNIVVYDEEFEEIKKVIDSAKSAGVDAIIASDMAAVLYAREKGVEVHMSTQVNISNVEAVKFYSQFSDVVVLARELKLEQIKKIHEEIKKQNIRGPKGELVKIEAFVHGALCISVSGKCYFSLACSNHSANRGDCLQPCRKAYKIIDEETGEELKTDNKYIMSPKDLCTIGNVPQLIEAGVEVFKIEGRGKPVDYVYTTVKCYKEAALAYEKVEFSGEKVEGWLKELEKVFNRGFWKGGYYMGIESEKWASQYGSNATKQRVYIGKVRKYYPKLKVAEFVYESGKKDLNEGDEIFFTGKTTGIVNGFVRGLRVCGKTAQKATKGDEVTLETDERVRVDDEVYLFTDRFERQGVR